MARNRIRVNAPAGTVFAVLSDPRAYAGFVVGTKRIRRFDPTWPELGSAFHHTIGTGPMMLRDATRVVEVEDGHRLVLEAGMGPIGVSRITFTLNGDGYSTNVTMVEYPCAGPLAQIRNSLIDGLFTLRNSRLLRRLKRLAERREQQRAQLA